MSQDIPILLFLVIPLSPICYITLCSVSLKYTPVLYDLGNSKYHTKFKYSVTVIYTSINPQYLVCRSLPPFLMKSFGHVNLFFKQPNNIICRLYSCSISCLIRNTYLTSSESEFGICIQCFALFPPCALQTVFYVIYIMNQICTLNMPLNIQLFISVLISFAFYNIKFILQLM